MCLRVCVCVCDQFGTNDKQDVFFLYRMHFTERQWKIKLMCYHYYNLLPLLHNVIVKQIYQGLLTGV
jgi:hypothetical protein